MPREPPKPKTAPPLVSVDQAIKELLQLHPVDTLEFLFPEVVLQRGAPLSWRFHNVQVRKRDLTRKGLVMDLNIEYRFRHGSPLLMVLVEHWSTARSVDLLRTAQYFLDLSSRFPEHEIVPVALITEIGGGAVTDHFTRNALGREVLRFATRVVQLSRTEAESWAQTKNVVAVTLLMAMGGALSRLEKLHATIRFFQNHDDEETRLLFPLISEVGKLTNEEHAMTIKYLTQLPKPLFMKMMEDQAKAEGMEQGLERGLEQGIRSTNLDKARRMLQRGYDWAAITDITDIRPEDLDVSAPT